MNRTSILTLIFWLLLLSLSGSGGFAAPVIDDLRAAVDASNNEVTISGKISAGEGKQVTVKVLDPNGKIDYIDQTTSASGGYFSFRYKPAHTVAGTYSVQVGGEGIANPVRTSFRLLNQPSQGGGSGGGGGGSGSPGTKETKAKEDAQESGRLYEETIDGATVIISMNKEEVEAYLASRPNVEQITLETNADAAAVKAQILASIIDRLALNNSEAILEIKTKRGSYRLPVKTIKLEEILPRLSASIDEVTVEVKLEVVPDVRFADGGNDEALYRKFFAESGAEIIADIVSFRVEISGKGKTVPLDDFGSTYVERVIPVKKESIRTERATAITYDSNGNYRFVPAVFTQREGGWVATIKHNRNGMYTVLENARTFADLDNHWARKEVEMLASKLVLSGTSETSFEPDAWITRAQAASLLVKALGLKEEGTSRYKDVPAHAWYSGAVAAAAEKGLIKGYEDGRFQPDRRITRQEWAVLLHRAMNFIGRESVSRDVDEPLKNFTDRDRIAAWAKKAVADLAAWGIAGGNADGKFAPDHYATRAETAAMMGRMLRSVSFIN